MRAAVAVVALVALVGCSDPHNARHTLKSAGYTSVEVGDHLRIGSSSLFSCGGGGVFRTRFRAVGPTGYPALGYVCRGVFGGSWLELG